MRRASIHGGWFRVISGQSGQWSVVSGQWSVVSGQFKTSAFVQFLSEYSVVNSNLFSLLPSPFSPPLSTGRQPPPLS